MRTPLSRLSPLAQSGVSENEYCSELLRMSERQGSRLLRVRGLPGPSSPAAMPAGWPRRTGETLQGAVTVLCLRPGEWLCLGDYGEEFDSVLASLDRSANVVHEQSDGLAHLRLEGPAAPWLLSKFGSLDFAGSTRIGAHCARTRMEETNVLVHYDGTAPGGFDLFVDRSLARHFWERFNESAPHAESLARQQRGAA